FVSARIAIAAFHCTKLQLPFGSRKELQPSIRIGTFPKMEARPSSPPILQRQLAVTNGLVGFVHDPKAQWERRAQAKVERRRCADLLLVDGKTGRHHSHRLALLQILQQEAAQWIGYSLRVRLLAVASPDLRAADWMVVFVRHGSRDCQTFAQHQHGFHLPEQLQTGFVSGASRDVAELPRAQRKRTACQLWRHYAARPAPLCIAACCNQIVNKTQPFADRLTSLAVASAAKLHSDFRAWNRLAALVTHPAAHRGRLSQAQGCSDGRLGA